MKDLSRVSRQEQEEFFNSFDEILCDIDGVLWIFYENISGASDAIKSLKKLGKRLRFVSNNCTKTPDNYHVQLKSAGFELEKDYLIIPTMAMIWYLKKQNFSKEIYLIGTLALKEELERAGFKIADYVPEDVGEVVGKFLKVSTTDNEKVGAVIVDMDVNVSYLKLQKAATYLRRPEVIFLAGSSETKLEFGSNAALIGPGYFHNILIDITGRKPQSLAKPSPLLNEFIKEKFAIEEPARVLFIGDTITEDMGFATNCGYKKLLVFSGLSKKESLVNWTFPEEHKPDYYVESLETLLGIISSINFG